MVSFPKVCHLGLENGTSFGNRVIADEIEGFEMRSYWTQSIGSSCHIGIWSSSIEVRGMESFPKDMSPGT
jgi:hypothetical protein